MILIVLPILCVLMFELGLTLKVEDFKKLAQQPRAVVAGMLGQLVLLRVIAYALASALQLPPLFFVGLVLIACCPGGSSSNVFSMLAKGDVALSVTLTAISSIVTLFTIPVIMAYTVAHCGTDGVQSTIELPVGKLLVQNLVLMFLPMLLGAVMQSKWANAADKTHRVLSKLAFPALMLLAGIFFVQHRDTIADNFALLGGSVLALLLACVFLAAALSWIMRLDGKRRRTIVIEVGMQNAAQAIAIATSPFILNKDEIAIPAIIYALLMNVVLLIYVGAFKLRNK
ncbi:MAG: bile acid:sodium symporter [Muribaculaceae bacterium]|nr:bile acid:sodium symporter [Muribaculaceae bacterium]